MDPKARLARENHRKAKESEELASRFLERRDELVRQLREEDPGRWSYTALAGAVGCSKELIAYILKRKPEKSSDRSLTPR